MRSLEEIHGYNLRESAHEYAIAYYAKSWQAREHALRIYRAMVQDYGREATDAAVTKEL